MKIRVRSGRIRTVYPLADRFQQTVYRAAYRGKAITGDAYAQDWRTAGWFEVDQGTDAEQIGPAIVSALEAEYNEERLDRLARNMGYEPTDSD